MAKQQELKVTERDNTLNPRKLREAGYIPVTIYGSHVPSVQLQAKAHDFTLLVAHGAQTFKLSGYVNATAKLQQLQLDGVTQKPVSVELLLVEGSLPQAGTPDKTSKKKGAKAEALSV